jgi:general secretion pathway protein A
VYNSYYRFRESPFGVTPDPQFYYSNAVYREAWATLRYGIEERKGFVVIVGAAGTGKTTLLRKALHEFPSTIKAAYIPNTLVSFTELLRLILKDLGLPSSTDDKFEMMEQLNEYLLEQFNSKHIVAVLLDEAQDLSTQCLEELRLLGNLETDKHKLLQLVLVGQPGLERKLNQPELVQLKQRIVLRCRLRPVESDEVGPYIESRLQTIGRTSADLFDPEAIEKIAFYSKGLPRLINIICDNALLTAYAGSKVKVSSSMIDEVADDLRIGQPRFEPGVENLTIPVEENASFEPTVEQQDNPASLNEPFTIASDDGLIDTYRDSTSSPGNSRYSKSIIIGTSAAAVLLTILGGFLYSQSRAFHSTSEIATLAPAGGNAMDQAKLAEAKLSKETSSNQYVPGAQTRNLAAAEKKVNGQVSTPLAIPNHKEAKAAPRDNIAKGASLRGNFFVAGTSFVRSKPTSTAEIIATLEPGTRVNIAGRTGSYYRLRSIGTETIRGYVHEEDAFFERR